MTTSSRVTIESTLEEKIEHARDLIKEARRTYPKVAVACSFGKDSLVTVHIARQVDPDIDVFAVMTPFKPQETFQYLVDINRKWQLNTRIYIVADNVPEALKDKGLNIHLLPPEKFFQISQEIENRTGKKIYEVDPDECCRLLKVDPTRAAVANLDAWVCGLRNTEGRTRVDYQEVENKGGLIKINPILTFTEAEIWRYMATKDIDPHPWYALGYRSLGCAPCSHTGGILERDGRWQNTSKCGGECGIHTRKLK